MGSRNQVRLAGKECGRWAVQGVLTMCVIFFVSGCKRQRSAEIPTISLDRIPRAAIGGPDPIERIAGKVIHAEPGAHIVLYAHSDGWYIQPYRAAALTEVGADGSWSSVTHLGDEYAALLVRPNYQPAPHLPSLPVAGGDLLAVASAKGTALPPVPATIIHFSGYDWKVRTALGDRGGEVCDYAASNVWVDDREYLHLKMQQGEEQWQCAGISLVRSLGYGTYRFVVADSAHLPPSPVLAIFTRQDQENAGYRQGLGIQLSRWSKQGTINADYVVSPYYIPGNSAHFTVPEGPMTHMLQWSPGKARFTTTRGASGAAGSMVKDHAFLSGIPIPSNETVRLDFYDYHHAQSGLRQPTEIVIQRFDYLP